MASAKTKARPNTRCRQERNSWMQRQGAKNHQMRDRPAGNPRRNALSAVVLETCGLRRKGPQSRLPGTEFLDAETKHQKSPLKCANAYRDQNPGSEWPENPVETPNLVSYRKRAVCKDWMVDAPGFEPGTR